MDHEERSDIDKVRLWTVVAITLVIIVDLVGAVIVRVWIGDAPVVMGDVAKVGAGILGGIAASTFMYNQDQNKPK